MYDIASMKKIETFIIKELNVNLSDAAIFKYDNDTYELFNKYIIKKKGEYEFLVITSYEQKVFSFLKNAVIWCTFKKRDKFYEMKRIEELDILLTGIDVLIDQHTKLSISANDYEDRLLYLAKLNEDKLKKQYMLTEIKKYVSDSKTWQLTKLQTTTKYVNK
jgi:hypothetical protein